MPVGTRHMRQGSPRHAHSQVPHMRGEPCRKLSPPVFVMRLRLQHDSLSRCAPFETAPVLPSTTAAVGSPASEQLFGL